MTLEGFDYAWGYSSKLPGALAKAGGKFALRYIGTSSKCLTPAERDALQTKGLGVGAISESTGHTWRGGHGAGQVDGGNAVAAARKLSMPTGDMVYFAVDEELLTADQHATALQYLDGCQIGLGLDYEARLYGQYSLIEMCPQGDHFQTYAWSHGKVSAKAGLYQYANNVTVGGASVDHCRTLPGGPTIVGGWLTYGAPPAPKPVPNPIIHPVANSRDKYRSAGNFNARAAAGVKFEKAQVHAGTAGWKNECAKLVRNAYGLPASAWGKTPTTAAGAFHAVPSKLTHSWYNPPVGVPVFWLGGSSGAGHVAFADGNGNCWSNDFSASGYVGDGRVRLVPIASISAHDSALRYVGWSETYLGTRVYD